MYFTEFIGMQSLTNVILPSDQVIAKDLKLPLSFFLNKSKPKCKGCIGCESDSDNVSANLKLNFSKIND